MSIDPAAYGPGKEVTGEMALDYAAANWQKFILMLLQRLGVNHVVLNEADLDNLMALPDGTGLGIQTREDGIHLFIAGRALAESMNAVVRIP